MARFADRGVVVTGAAQGIGRGIVQAFLERALAGSRPTFVTTVSSRPGRWHRIGSRPTPWTSPGSVLPPAATPEEVAPTDPSL